MKVDESIPWPAVQLAAERLELVAEWHKGGRITVHPKPGSDRWRIERGSGWKGGPAYACMHGHEALIEALLRRFPDATIETAAATYFGYEDMLEQQGRIREQLVERYRRDRCTCEGAIWHSTLSETSP